MRIEPWLPGAIRRNFGARIFFSTMVSVVGAAIQEETASLADVAEQTESLSTRTNDLRRRLDTFVLNAGSGAPTTEATPSPGVAADGGDRGPAEHPNRP